MVQSGIMAGKLKGAMLRCLSAMADTYSSSLPGANTEGKSPRVCVHILTHYHHGKHDPVRPYDYERPTFKLCAHNAGWYAAGRLDNLKAAENVSMGI
jgi:hypothetical protein